jgi:hypothetical protein
MATPQLMDPEEVSAKARATTDGFLKDDALARAKGAKPEQVAARQRLAKFFCDSHFAAESAELRAGRLAQIDYTAPLATVNGRTVDVQNPKAKGFLGMGRKPAYFVSATYPPQTPEDPIYALEYFPLKA